jgi:hypothetical protein
MRLEIRFVPTFTRVTENYGYSADRLQLTSQTATKSGNTLMSLTYNYVAPKSRVGVG